MKTEMAAHNHLPATSPEVSVVELIREGMQHGIPVESMERLMAMRDKELARRAESEFTEAMSDFQRRCPVIVKGKQVERKGGGKLYSYAPLEEIVRQVKDLEHECGFSHAFDTAPAESGGVEVTCIVKHRGGHSERTTIYMPHTQGMNTNAAQDAGIAVTYGKRLSFTNAFGIMTADEDRDGRDGTEKSADQLYKDMVRHMQAVINNMESVQAIKGGITEGDLSTAAEAWFELSDDDKAALWRAPSKGGVFTTEERAVIKSSEFRQAHFGDDAA